MILPPFPKEGGGGFDRVHPNAERQDVSVSEFCLAFCHSPYHTWHHKSHQGKVTPLCYLPLIGETRIYAWPMQDARRLGEEPAQGLSNGGTEGVVMRMSLAEKHTIYDVVYNHDSRGKNAADNMLRALRRNSEKYEKNGCFL